MPDQREHRHGGILIAATLVFVIYIFFPIVLVLPLELGIKHGILPPATRSFCGPFFAPLGWLYDRCPPYRALIEAEGGIFVRNGVIDEF